MPASRTRNPTVGRLRDNILRAFDRLRADELLEGMKWYAAAHCRIVDTLAVPHGLPTHRAVGVVAALSPGCSWTQNVQDAGWLMHTPSERLPLTSYKANVRKALAILQGADPAEVLGGRKVRAFYHNLMFPHSSPEVTIDRHAVRVALGRGVSSRAGSKLIERVGVYDRFAEAYTLAGERMAMLGLQVQAATWIQWRAQEGITV